MQAVLPALKQKSPAQNKAVPRKPGTLKHDSNRQVVGGPKPGSTPLRDLSNGSKPTRPSAPSPLKDCAKSSHSADKKAISGGTAATRVANSKLEQPAAKLQSSHSKESKTLTSNAVAKSKSHSTSSNTGMKAFSKGLSPQGLVKGRAASDSSHQPKSRRVADASSRTVSSAGVVSAQPTTQTQPSHFAFSPFRSVKGQQAEGQQEKGKAAPQLAAMATTWSNPMFAYSIAPPSFCGSAPASSLVSGDHAKPEAHIQPRPLPLESARQAWSTRAAEPNKSSRAVDDLIRQMQRLAIAASCASFSCEPKTVLPAMADPADALQSSADAAQASSAPAGTLSSSGLSMPCQSTPGASGAAQAALLVAEPLSAAAPAACFAETADGPGSALLEPSGTHQDNADVSFGSSTSDCEQPALAIAVAQTAQAVMAGSPMMASTPAASEASDASHAELYAMLDAGLLDSPSPSAGSFTGVAPAVGRRDVSPVPFGSLSASHDVDEDAILASSSAAMDSFSQAAVQTEGTPGFDNAHGFLTDEMLGDVMSWDEMLVEFNTLLTPSSPQTWDASAAAHEVVLQAGFDHGSLVSGGMEATSINAHQHGGSQAADNSSPVVTGQASSEPALTGAYDMELLAGDSSFLDLR